MDIHAMCLVKNEADIISQTLMRSLEWCDHVYVYDNGSDDGTWDLVRDLASRFPQIICFKQEAKPFRDNLRSEVFEAYRHRSALGDWWCRLDADEFYIDNPRIFLAKIPGKYSTVWTASFDYYLTNVDADQFRNEPGLCADDVPIEDRCRYYLNHWSEPRFFRYDPKLTWKGAGGFPDGIVDNAAYPVRIWQRHFAYRSPRQVETRLRSRQAAVQEGEFAHEALNEWSGVIGAIRDNPDGRIADASPVYATARWTDRLVDASKLDYDAHDGRFVVNEDLMPKLPVARGAMVKFFHRTLIRTKGLMRQLHPRR